MGAHAGALFYHGCRDDDAKSGGIHALVIGVSDYTTGMRGDGDLRFDDVDGTAVGAARFASFLADGFHDPAGRIVRTVRLLLSPTDDERTWLPAGVPAADFEAVGDALDAWRADCDSDRRNVALLYVAGHGVVTTDGVHWLFLRRASNAGDAFRHTVNLVSVQENMAFCRAEDNIYVFDCCASPDVNQPPMGGSGGLTIAPFPARDGPVRDFSVTVRAARTGTKTYALGPRHGTALSWALIGVPDDLAPVPLVRTAGEVVDGLFAITPRRLHDELLPAMRKHKKLSAISGNEPLVHPKESQRTLILPDPPPTFRLTLVCPPEDRGRVNLVVHRTNGSVAGTAEDVRGEAEFDLFAGTYRYTFEVVTETGADREHHRIDVGGPRRIIAATGVDA